MLNQALNRRKRAQQAGRHPWLRSVWGFGCGQGTARCCGVAPTTPPMMHRRLAAPCLPRQANQRSACTLVPPLRTAGGSLKHQHWILPAAQRLLISPTLSRTPFSVPGHSCCTVVASIFFCDGNPFVDTLCRASWYQSTSLPSPPFTNIPSHPLRNYHCDRLQFVRLRIQPPPWYYLFFLPPQATRRFACRGYPKGLRLQ